MSSAGVQQHPVDDEPHEQRLDHLQSRRHQGEHEDRDHGVAMRPEPAQVLAQVLTPLAGRTVGAGGRDAAGGRGCAEASIFRWLRRSVEAPPRVVPTEG